MMKGIQKWVPFFGQKELEKMGSKVSNMTGLGFITVHDHVNDERILYSSVNAVSSKAIQEYRKRLD